MNLLIIGILLVFAKTNLQLLDTGVFFYATNALGYGAICLGLWQLADQLPRVRRLLPVAAVMVVHSTGFALLNGTGHSIQTISLTSSAATAAALALAALAVGGLMVIFYILHEVLLAIRNDGSANASNWSHLEKMPGLLLILLVLTTVLFFIAPSSASVLMLILLGGEMLFVVRLSRNLLSHSIS